MGKTSENIAETRVSPALWAAYLACSWTWCIGMFLPVLLVRDYGWPGFAVFAVPNVIGAAAMGWVLRNREASERLVRRHVGAGVVFSAVTIGFHIFFLLWALGMVQRIGNLPDWGMIAATGAAVAAIAFVRLAARTGDGAVGVVSWVVLLVSAGAVGSIVAQGPAFTPTTGEFLDPGATPSGIVWLAPVCVFGFALCPYLDLTFHHARQGTTPAGGRLAFTLGFGVLFAAMIGLTMVYAGAFIGLLGRGGVQPVVWASWVPAAILVHVIVQLVFTVIVHLRRISASPLADRGQMVVLTLAMVAVLLGLMHERLPMYAGLTGGEIVYRCFMAFYGLVFPAYVWLVVIPTRRDAAADLGRRAMRVCALSVGVAAPMYWMGFVGGREVWLAPGLGIVLAARLLIR